MSRVVVEIPKQACTSGIRKITFKFSKSKEDHINSEESRLNPPAVEDRSRNMNVTADKYPINVKKLLSTGILEGAQVKYISATGELCGIVRRKGYLCGCSECNFSKVVSAFEFELHAGGKSRHPNAHIFMDNGNPIYSIIQKLRDDMIRDVAGSSFNEEAFRDWKANIEGINEMVKADKNDIRLPSRPYSVVRQDLEEGSGASCFFEKLYSKQKIDIDRQMPEEPRYMVNKPTSQMFNFCAYKRRTVEGAPKRRDNDLHRLLFKPNGLPDGAEVAYYMKGQRILGGYKQGSGIVCSCCDNEISPSQFESHAGWAARRQPYRHICTSNGQTLHDIAMSLAKGHSFTTGGSDDMCATCGDGGDLMLCKGCPRAFHADTILKKYSSTADKSAALFGHIRKDDEEISLVRD